MDSHDTTPAERHNSVVNFVLDFMTTCADAINEMDDEELNRSLHKALSGRFSAMKPEEVHKALIDVLQRLDEDKAVRSALMSDERDFNERCLALFDGLPATTDFGQAIKLKAEQGDEFALQLRGHHPHLSSREYNTDGGAA